MVHHVNMKKKSLLGNQAWGSSVPFTKKCPIKTAEWEVICLIMEDGLSTDTWGRVEQRQLSNDQTLIFL